MVVYACLVVSVVAFGCTAYFLLSGEVPMVVFFAPIGEVTRHENPAAYWVFVISHLFVAIAALVLAKRKA